MMRATRAAVLALIATVGAWPALDEKLQSYPAIHARETAKIKAGDAKTAKYILFDAFHGLGRFARRTSRAQCGAPRGVQGGPVIAFRRRSRPRRAAPSARREESCQEGGPPRFKRDAVARDCLKSKLQG